MKTSYLFWLLVALVAGAWPLLPLANATSHPTQTVSVESAANG